MQRNYFPIIPILQSPCYRAIRRGQTGAGPRISTSRDPQIPY